MLAYTDYDTRLAAYAVIVDDRGPEPQLLLTLWNEGERPQWGLPGGGVELEETVEQGLVREIREETGYDAEVGTILGVDTHIVPAAERVAATGRPLRAVRVYYTARVVGGELANEVDGTTDEARWFPLAAVPELDRVAQVEVGLGLWRDATR